MLQLHQPAQSYVPLQVKTTRGIFFIKCKLLKFLKLVSFYSSIQKFHLDRVSKEFADIESDVNSIVTQIDACFDLLIPKFIVDENQSDDFHFRPMRGLSFSIILNTNVEIVRDSSNADLVDNLRELCGELNRLYSKKLTQFDESINKLKLPLFAEQFNEIISSVRCLKVKIGTIIWKFNEVNILDNLPKTKQETNEDDTDDDDEDDDSFEDVPDREGRFMNETVLIAITF